MFNNLLELKMFDLKSGPHKRLKFLNQLKKFERNIDIIIFNLWCLPLSSPLKVSKYVIGYLKLSKSLTLKI